MWSERFGRDLRADSNLPRMLLSAALRRNRDGLVLFSTTRPERAQVAAEAATQSVGAIGCRGGNVQRIRRRDSARLPGGYAAAMIEDLRTTSEDINIQEELVVIGAGPAGIVVALEAARNGHSVVLLESGQLTFDPTAQELSEAAAWDRHRHAPVSLAVRRQVGGTSVIWGGAAYPLTRWISRLARSWVCRPGRSTTRPYRATSSGPVTGWSAAGLPSALPSLSHLPEGIVPGFTDDGVLGSSLERWSLPDRLWRRLSGAAWNGHRMSGC